MVRHGTTVATEVPVCPLVANFLPFYSCHSLRGCSFLGWGRMFQSVAGHFGPDAHLALVLLNGVSLVEDSTRIMLRGARMLSEALDNLIGALASFPLV